MATRTEATRSSTVGTPTPWMTRLKQGLPWVAFALWTAGFVGIWYLGSSQNWSPALFIAACMGWVCLAAVAARDAVQKAFGPVFLYEVVRLGRKRSTFILRALYVIAILAVLGLQYGFLREDVAYYNQDIDKARIPAGRLAQFATEFFISFSCIQFCVVTFLTPAYVAGCIADEKEKKTLEFLLATDLRGHEIIFGKLAARVFNLLMYVMAGLPFMAFMQLFGGIDIDLLIASTALTAVTVIGVAAVSIYFSTTLKRPRDAIAMTYLLLAVYGIGTGLLAIGMEVLVRLTYAPLYLFNYQIDVQALVNWLDTTVEWLTSGNVLVMMTKQLRTGLFGGFTGSGLITAISRYSAFWFLITFLTLGYSTLRLRAIALHQFYGESRNSKKNRDRKRPEIGDDPMFWKEVFTEGTGRSGCAAMIVSITIVLLVFSIPVMIFVGYFGEYIPILNYYFNIMPSNQPTSVVIKNFRESINIWMRVTSGVIGALLLLSVTNRGSGAVSGERDRDTWISLISTPLEAWEMVRAKWYGCVLGARRGYYLILLVWGIALVCGAVEPIMLLITAIHFAVYISAFAWLGILCSINSRTTMIASIRALLIGLLIGGGHWLLLLLCCFAPLSILSRGSGLDGIESIFILLGAATPPFMLGWLPLNDFSSRQLEIFEYHERHNVFGLFAPVIGFVIWVVIGRVLALLSWYDFRIISNRDVDTLSRRLQDIKDQHKTDTKEKNPQIRPQPDA